MLKNERMQNDNVRDLTALLFAEHKANQFRFRTLFSTAKPGGLSSKILHV